MHVDLIAGLPGEDVASFARGFDRLVELKPHEIQFGILKRLRGTPIIRHTVEFDLVFDPHPPYTILANRDIDDAIAYYLSENAEQAAFGFIDALEQAYAHISRHPATGSGLEKLSLPSSLGEFSKGSPLA